MVKYSITYVTRNISNTGGKHHETVQSKMDLRQTKVSVRN